MKDNSEALSEILAEIANFNIFREFLMQIHTEPNKTQSRKAKTEENKGSMSDLWVNVKFHDTNTAGS